MMTILSRETIAKICRCDTKTVSRAGLPKVKGRVFDIDDPEVWRFIQGKLKDWEERHGLNPVSDRKSIESLKKFDSLEGIKKLADLDMPGEDEIESLADRKIWEEIAVLKLRKIKFAIEVEEKKMILIPRDLADRWYGYLASGVENNFLTLPETASRGDPILRDRLKPLVTRGIRKTIDDALEGVKRDEKALRAKMRDEEEKEEAETDPKGAGTGEESGKGKVKK